MKLRTVLLCSGAAVFALGAIAFAATDEEQAAAETEVAAASQPAEMTAEARAELEGLEAGLTEEIKALLEQEIALSNLPRQIDPQALAELESMNSSIPAEIRALLEQELALAGAAQQQFSPEAIAELEGLSHEIPAEVRLQLEQELAQSRSISTAPGAPASAEGPSANAAPCPFAWTPEGSHGVYVHGMPAPAQLDAARERLLSEIAALKDSGELTPEGAAQLEKVIEELGESMKVYAPAPGDQMFFAPGAPPMGFAMPSPPPMPGFGNHPGPQAFSMPLPPPHPGAGEWLEKNQSLSIEMDENGEVIVNGEGFSEEELNSIRESIKHYGHWRPEDFGMFAVPAMPPHGAQGFFNHAVPFSAPSAPGAPLPPGAQGEWQNFYHPAPGFELGEEWQSDVDALMGEIGELLKEFMQEHQAAEAEGSGSN